MNDNYDKILLKSPPGNYSFFTEIGENQKRLKTGVEGCFTENIHHYLSQGIIFRVIHPKTAEKQGQKVDKFASNFLTGRKYH